MINSYFCADISFHYQLISNERILRPILILLLRQVRCQLYAAKAVAPSAAQYGALKRLCSACAAREGVLFRAVKRLARLSALL
jgi:hypothetical protein